ncbi:MAG: hypothetical protein A2Y03_01855 [Omnitrophica WOR_2 bacterium GWF2_38_59]|nr:MAG: hypothetical protein A2Y03_01855 [Omnitrophica WOR_2 bacterium GWF2_38_59]OGX50906.1 MAG: hypothetical protein A2243_06445 [Omnitrophica WOR_2 bacterium RIFOXYA2_FULL_38_17]OGX55301.1 MAG: hypothetical protein A2447_00720 [Omnitrophica WOR_2 bacterium RIFOXYC2_FULL_38_12]OGX60552.1 MAG: hypothetical protein A2306_03070 [Omnitrophica WOR_2 bacterium RIFOXYB2_FULL_38_16]HBG61713.1 hypothetical protein [Candidatus Omnitrophota bacterium]
MTKFGKKMKKTMFLILALLLMVNLSYAENDLSVLDNSIVLKNVSNYEQCKSKEEVIAEYRKSIGQWVDYVNNLYGEVGLDWELVGHKLVQNDNVQWTEKREIMLLSSGKIIILYFNITEPVNLFLQELAKYNSQE